MWCNPAPCDEQVQAFGGLGKLQQQPLDPIPHPGEELPKLLEFGQQVAQQGAAAPGVSPDRLSGDHVQVFSELAAGHGALGRFPGPGVMPLVCEFLGSA